MTTTPQREVTVLPEPAAITHRAANEFLEAVDEAVSQKGTFTVPLAGGSTPKALYALLAEDLAYRSKIPWPKVHFFFGDERHVPPDHHDSNFQKANEALFSKGVVKAGRITRIRGEYADTQKAALEYEQALRAYFKLKDGASPRFDLVRLGMGDEGHCLSLFPGTQALHASRRIVVRKGRQAVYGARHADSGSRQAGESRDLFGYPLGQGSGLKGGSGRSLRAGATPGSMDPTGQWKPPLAGGPGRRLDAGNRNSQLTRRNTWLRLLSVQSNNT